GHFTFGESISWNETSRRIVPAADIGATGGVVQEIMLDQPVIPVDDSTHLGGFGGAPSYLHNQGGNPLGDLVLKKHTFHNNSFHATAHGQFDFLKHFSYKILAGYNVRNTYEPNYTPAYFFSNQRQAVRASLSETRG